MRVLVVDDEAPARERLLRMLEPLDSYTVCGEAATGQAALALAAEQQPDILLMDIRMPGMDGLEAARHLLVLEQPPAIIFTTAYSDHALEAFEMHAVDYLLKPVRRERLAEALANARRLTRVQAAALRQTVEQGTARTRICARVRGSLQLIPVEEVRYFLADQKYLTVATPEGQVLIEETLKSLEDEFREQFIRVHRNALVAVRFLRGLEKDTSGHYRVLVDGVDECLEVSRRHVADVRQRIKLLQS